jgi:hypothetical protein
MMHEGRALLTWKRYGVFLDRVDVVQRQENKDQRCLQHVCRRSHPLNLNMERSFQSDAFIMLCCPSVFWFIEWVWCVKLV